MSSSHWCYRCSRFVRLTRHDILMCPECDSGFVEEIDPPSSRAIHVDGRRRRFPAAAMYMIGHHNNNHRPTAFDNQNPSRRAHRHQLCMNIASGSDRTPFNPVIMLRNTSAEGTSREGGETGRGFELFYDDGGDSGLRPLPPTMSEFLLGTGFDRVLEHLTQIETNGGFGGRHDHNHPLPASKTAVEALPTIEINNTHLATESYCAVCKEPFEISIAAKEMPCKHIYHSECILPWLAIRNSCPVCRHELPVKEEENPHGADLGQSSNNEEENNPNPNSNSNSNSNSNPSGLTIWRLPGGGFAVGRFSGGIRRGTMIERDNIPVVYTEIDNSSNSNNVGSEPTRISWSVTSSPRGIYRVRESGGGRNGFRRMVNNLFGCFRGGGVNNNNNDNNDHPQQSDNNSSPTRELSQPLRMRSTHSSDEVSPSHPNGEPSQSPRSRRTWSMVVNSGTRPW